MKQSVPMYFILSSGKIRFRNRLLLGKIFSC